VCISIPSNVENFITQRCSLFWDPANLSSINLEVSRRTVKMSTSNPFWAFTTPFTSHSSSLHNIQVPSTEDIHHSHSHTTPDTAWSQASFQEHTFTYDAVKGKYISSLDDTGTLPQNGSWPLTEKYYSLAPANHDVRCPKRTLWGTILLPTLAIILPMTCLVAFLLGLIFGYRVKSEASLFNEVSNSHALNNHAVVLVNYSATRIAFVASWASTVAPLLAGFIMNLMSYKTALLMYHSSLGSSQSDLPTPYQYSLLIGLCLASSGRLRRYFSYTRKEDVMIPPVLRRAARTLSITLLLALIIFGADTALHYTASTINFDQISVSASTHAYGYGLSSTCLALNRTANFGMPCSRNGEVALANETEYIAGQNEIFFLQHGTSNISQVKMVSAPAYMPPSDSSRSAAQVALLVPQSTRLSPWQDFQASTTGVVTTCEPITSQCNFATSPLGPAYSTFNCSANFWGILGKAPNVSDSGFLQDSAVPPLGFKPGSALQYSFFTDKNLSIPYDSTGALGPFLTDDQLINPVYMGVAARFAATAQRAGVNMSTDPEIFSGATQFLDLTLRCRYTTYLVDYNWVNSTATINTMKVSPNGTTAEIFHGYNIVNSFNSFDSDLQDIILGAALETDPQSLADAFANSYSSRVMSVIGPFLSSRNNIQEQTRNPLLVAKIPKIPLAILVAGCCCYVIFGIVSAMIAYRALRTVDVRDLAFRFSLPALGLHAFKEPVVEKEVVDLDKDGKHRVFDESKIRGETMRVAVEGDPRNGFVLRSLV
jgi:hypothetical protein